MNLQKTMKLLYEIKAILAFIMLMQVGLLVLNVVHSYRLSAVKTDNNTNYWLMFGFVTLLLREIRYYQQTYNKKTNNQETQST